VRTNTATVKKSDATKLREDGWRKTGFMPGIEVYLKSLLAGTNAHALTYWNLREIASRFKTA
jgi:hypothetical protein